MNNISFSLVFDKSAFVLNNVNTSKDSTFHDTMDNFDRIICNSVSMIEIEKIFIYYHVKSDWCYQKIKSTWLLIDDNTRAFLFVSAMHRIVLTKRGHFIYSYERQKGFECIGFIEDCRI